MSDPITRLNAALEGRYRIERQLGEGGMATVYLADDLRHERKVALKVLKPELAAVVGADRFLAEIKTTANLQHPHILPLHDSGEADGFLYYVMPFIEGESLRERLEREHQLPVEEATRIATDVAEALHSAHEQGVIHRDIKPGNILLSQGRSLVADFGIALAVSAAGGGRMTETGLSMGTPFYMSPEQASADRAPTPSSDVYSLGCVLYEMLVGDPPHVGSSAQAVLARILTGEAPSARAERPSIPPNVDAAIRKALEKLPADRFTKAQDFARALADSAFRHGRPESSSSVSFGGQWTRLTAAFATLAAVLAAATLWSLQLRGPSEDNRPIRFTVPVPGGNTMGMGYESPSVALAPDGRTLVYTEGGVFMKRAFDAEESVRLDGTEGAEIPFFSPDGRSIGFLKDGELRRMPVDGGAATRLIDLPVGDAHGGADWAEDGAIVYARSALGIWRAPVGGGTTAQVTVPDRGAGENVHHWPQSLEGGRLLLFSAVGESGNWRDSKVVLMDLESGERWVAVEGGAYGFYVPSGHVVYADENGNIRAQPFDLRTRSRTGEAIAAETGVQLGQWGAAASFTLSDRGDIAFTRGDPWRRSLLVWFDRAGNRLSQLGDATTAAWGLELEPGGRRIATALPDRLNDDVFLLEEGIATPDRLTTAVVGDGWPVWSPDGTRLAWQADAPIGDQYPVMVTDVDGSGEADVLYQNEYRKWPTSWSPDGRWLISAERWPETGLDLYAIDVVGDSARIPIAVTDAHEEFGRVSPDGRWVAYVSDETGSTQVYVVSFPDVRQRRQVTRQGGEHPRWSSDSELVFWQDKTLMAARLRTDADFAVEEIQPLFDVPDFSYSAGDPRYTVTPGGERFLIMLTSPESPAREIHVALNWSRELEAGGN